MVFDLKVFGGIARTDEFVERSKALPLASAHEAPDSGRLHDQLKENIEGVLDETSSMRVLSTARVKVPDGTICAERELRCSITCIDVFVVGYPRYPAVKVTVYVSSNQSSFISTHPRGPSPSSRPHYSPFLFIIDTLAGRTFGSTLRV